MPSLPSRRRAQQRGGSANPLCVIVNLIWCVRTVTDEGHSVRATNAAVPEHYFERYRIARGTASVSNGSFPLSRRDGGQRRTGRTGRPILRPCVIAKKTQRTKSSGRNTKLIDSRQVGPALDRYDDCMRAGLPSLSLSFSLPCPSSASLAVSLCSLGANRASAEKTSELHTVERSGYALRERKAKPDLELARACGPRTHRTEDYKRESTEHGIIHSAPPTTACRVATAGTVASRREQPVRRRSPSNVRSERARATRRQIYIYICVYGRSLPPKPRLASLARR